MMIGDFLQVLLGAAGGGAEGYAAKIAKDQADKQKKEELALELEMKRKDKDQEFRDNLLRDALKQSLGGVHKNFSYGELPEDFGALMADDERITPEFAMTLRKLSTIRPNKAKTMPKTSSSPPAYYGSRPPSRPTSKPSKLEF